MGDVDGPAMAIARAKLQREEMERANAQNELCAAKAEIARLTQASTILGQTVTDLHDRLKECQAERDELRRQIDSTYCAYCGHAINVGDTAASRDEAAILIGVHIATCPKHPMRSIEAERDIALKQLAELRRELEEQ